MLRKLLGAWVALLLALTPAAAPAQLLLTGVGPGASSTPASPVTLTWQGSCDKNANTDGSNNYTCSAMAVGTADANRLVCVVFGTRDSSGFQTSTVTIGGVSASFVIHDSASTRKWDAACAVVPT